MHKCQCRIDNSEEALRERCKLAGVTGEGWKLEQDFWSLPGREEMEKTVREMAADFNRDGGFGWLTLVSPYGLGKSAIGEWLVIQAVKAGRRAWFATDADVKEAISAQFRGDNGLLTRMADTSVLVFDQPDWLYDKDGGSYQVNQARSILDRRYRLRDCQTTVLLLNLTAWESRAESGLAAIFSRAEEGKIVISRAAGIRPAIGKTIEEKA
jgi:hypothetical protein